MLICPTFLYVLLTPLILLLSNWFSWCYIKPHIYILIVGLINYLFAYSVTKKSIWYLKCETGFDGKCSIMNFQRIALLLQLFRRVWFPNV